MDASPQYKPPPPPSPLLLLLLLLLLPSAVAVFSWFFDVRANLGNVKEKPIRKTCFSGEMKHLALASSKTWTQIMKNLDLEKPGP